jgi:hypothetical protein
MATAFFYVMTMALIGSPNVDSDRDIGSLSLFCVMAKIKKGLPSSLFFSSYLFTMPEILSTDVRFFMTIL